MSVYLYITHYRPTSILNAPRHAPPRDPQRHCQCTRADRGTPHRIKLTCLILVPKLLTKINILLGMELRQSTYIFIVLNYRGFLFLMYTGQSVLF